MQESQWETYKMNHFCKNPSSITYVSEKNSLEQKEGGALFGLNSKRHISNVRNIVTITRPRI